MTFSITRYYPALVNIVLLTGIHISSVIAAPGPLPDSPLFVTTSAAANVFFEVDDSGSMDSDILTKEHWQACAYRSGTDDCGFFVKDGFYYGPLESIDVSAETTNYMMIYFLTDEIDNVYTNSALGNYLNTRQQYDWRIKSPSVNVMYYNPEVTYLPWELGDGTSMTAANFTSVKSDPQPGSDGYNATRSLNGFAFNIWSDTHGFSGEDRPKSGTSNQSLGANGSVDWWDNHTSYTVNTSSIVVKEITATAANEAVSRTFSLTGGLNGRTLTQEKQNIANWYQYHRRRAFVTKAALSKVITDNSDYRYGLNFINDRGFYNNGSFTRFIEMPNASHGTLSHNTALIQSLFGLDWPGLGTPLRQGLERAGEYYDNADGRTDPIIEQCQQNYTVLFTDGYWNQYPPVNTSIVDNDGDGHSPSIADIAKYYYDKDLSSLNNNVVGNIFDPVDYQHMVTYTVAFGVSGKLVDTDNDGWPGNSPGLSESDDWGNPFVWGSGEKIDDLWHAAYNSRGKFISARTPQEVSDGLSDALSNISDRSGSATAVDFNSSSLSENSTVYLTLFDSNNYQWSGDLLAYSLDATTGVSADNPTWSASSQLDARTSGRRVFTYNKDTGESVRFRWRDLTNLQKADLKKNPDNSNSTNIKAKARLNYLKGERINEELESGGTNGDYTFRRRSHLLGDIVHSTPMYTGKPKQIWPNSSPFPAIGSTTYESFKTGAASFRTPIIYVGSNDGMLHGFRASNGRELFSYIPGFLFSSSSATSGLHYLTDPAYTHRYYADMPITVADAYFGATPSWHSVLIGGGRSGGRGIFALDVTAPSTLTNANAANIALWEFDSTDDPALGFTYSNPTIALMNNNRWAAIFGNGYNSSDTGEAALFIVFLDGGSSGTWTEGVDYLKITTGVGSLTSGACGNSCNGLSTPQPIDIDGDKVVDRIYAGDLQGNMWVFDVSAKITNTDDPRSSWDVAHKLGGTSIPLFKATYHNTSAGIPIQVSTNYQPITSKPVLVKHPSKLGGDPDVLVFFGTGQYLVDADLTNAEVQSFYGVWDNSNDALTSSLTPANLVEQEFVGGNFTANRKDINNNDVTVDVTSQIRVLTDNEVDYAGVKKGWFLNLSLESGERVVADPVIYEDLVLFNTSIPSTNPCDPGGSGFLMLVDQINGGKGDTAGFDFDGDGEVNTDDGVNDDGGHSKNPGGKKITDGGLPSKPKILGNKLYITSTESDKPVPPVTLPTKAVNRRLSWQELRD